jgi:hypothetical protein
MHYSQLSNVFEVMNIKVYSAINILNYLDNLLNRQIHDHGSQRALLSSLRKLCKRIFNYCVLTT